ncbi:hypothetical protein ACH35V_41535 [Actinomadura sp. 1N219]|uniref:hypothetical protein n=1 Tax=Actinomadura sp. 1N219 TaxID=3375152 RepID=UPI003795323E
MPEQSGTNPEHDPVYRAMNAPGVSLRLDWSPAKVREVARALQHILEVDGETEFTDASRTRLRAAAADLTGAVDPTTSTAPHSVLTLELRWQRDTIIDVTVALATAAFDHEVGSARLNAAVADIHIAVAGGGILMSPEAPSDPAAPVTAHQGRRTLELDDTDASELLTEPPPGIGLVWLRDIIDKIRTFAGPGGPRDPRHGAHMVISFRTKAELRAEGLTLSLEKAGLSADTIAEVHRVLGEDVRTLRDLAAYRESQLTAAFEGHNSPAHQLLTEISHRLKWYNLGFTPEAPGASGPADLPVRPYDN